MKNKLISKIENIANKIYGLDELTKDRMRIIGISFKSKAMGPRSALLAIVISGLIYLPIYLLDTLINDTHLFEILFSIYILSVFLICISVLIIAIIMAIRRK